MGETKMTVPSGVRSWILAGLALTGAAPGMGAAWHPIGPDGGAAAPIVMAPSAPRTGYVLAYGLFRTDDGATSWRHVDASFAPNQLLLVDPRDAETLYAMGAPSGYERLMRSVDGGRHWAVCGAGLPVDWTGHVFLSGLVLSSGSHVWLAGTEQGLFQSADDGASFTPAGFAGVDVLALAAAPDGRLWLATTQDDVLVEVRSSVDGGAAWVSSGQDIQAFGVQAHFRFDPTTPALPFLLVGWNPVRVFQRDIGHAWHDLTPPGSLFDLLPLGGGRLLAAGTNAGRSVSTDGGVTWRGLGAPFLV
jgi:hypothetical protein